MLVYRPDKRCSAAKALRHPYIFPMTTAYHNQLQQSYEQAGSSPAIPDTESHYDQREMKGGAKESSTVSPDREDQPASDLSSSSLAILDDGGVLPTPEKIGANHTDRLAEKDKENADCSLTRSEGNEKIRWRQAVCGFYPIVESGTDRCISNELDSIVEKRIKTVDARKGIVSQNPYVSTSDRDERYSSAQSKVHNIAEKSTAFSAYTSTAGSKDRQQRQHNGSSSEDEPSRPGKYSTPDSLFEPKPKLLFRSTRQNETSSGSKKFVSTKCQEFSVEAEEIYSRAIAKVTPMSEVDDRETVQSSRSSCDSLQSVEGGRMTRSQSKAKALEASGEGHTANLSRGKHPVQLFPKSAIRRERATNKKRKLFN